MEPVSHQALPQLSWINTLYSNFSFAEGCGGESSEEACAADQEGPETLPYIDESPTTSPQISVNSQEPGLLLPLTPEALTTMIDVNQSFGPESSIKVQAKSRQATE
ncbi:active breakpoint cluster region-related protein-like [Narcine bancroftii]|uniref:active breakpoint cluster region-related protein-like n=1 Tax=Narcine bancroftii TaxID=1343680 RepID=UPI00383200FD